MWYGQSERRRAPSGKECPSQFIPFDPFLSGAFIVVLPHRPACKISLYVNYESRGATTHTSRDAGR
jgi:hypothetical protein